MSLYAGIELPGRPDLANVARLDRLPVPMILAMERSGIAVDVDYLRDFSLELGREMDSLAKEIAAYIPIPALDRFVGESSTIEEQEGPAEFNPASAVQVRRLLYETLGVGKKVNLKRTSQGHASTGRKQLELCRDDHPAVRLVLDYRQRAKLKTAFADTLPLRAVLHPRSASCPVCELPHTDSTYRIHTQFLTTRAETGRLASKGPNLQQIPIRSDLGGRIRRAFLASPGRRLVSVDFSQIELRDLAHLANAKSMIGLYHADRDIHLFTACECFRRDYGHYERLARLRERSRLTPEEKGDWNEFSLHCRLPAKNVNFGVAYGISAEGLQAQLALSGLPWTTEQCEAFIIRWFGLYPEVADYIDLQHYRARRYGWVWDPFGRIRRTPEVRSTLSHIRAQGLRQAVNMPIQSCSAGQTKLVMGALDETFALLSPSIRPLLSIHDQLIVEAEESEAEAAAEAMTDAFRHVMYDPDRGQSLWRVPIASDAEILSRWSKEEAA